MLKATKKSLCFLLAFILLSVTVFSNSFVQINATENEVTLYFVDSTSEKWIGNDNAVIECVDNTDYHKKYTMTKQSDHIWRVTVPSTAYNITFNRYNPEKSEQWNSWSAGGRDGNVTYLAQGHSHGQWTSQSYGTDYFEAGDVIYLDFSDFKEWSQDNALQYVNFTNASKAENNDQDIDISSASETLYAPIVLSEKISDTLYSYTVKETDSKSEHLRFWRGNDKTLWNCSIALSHADYAAGKNCIKITGWNQGDLTYYETDPNILIDTSPLTFDESLEAWFCDEKLDILNGTLTSTENITKMEYSVCDLSDNVLLSGTIDISNTWQITNFGLSYGYNNVTVTAITKSGKEYSNTVTVWNTASENLDNLTIDTSDTDEDGLNNYLELLHKTNPEKADTDDDQLLDSYEIYVFDTNPLLTDTDGNGIMDSEEDFDNDVLSNIYEVNLGTSPQYADTDNDGLTDGEEVNKYKTNPLKEDSDDDSLLDGSEITLGFDPNNKDTDNDSILDCDEMTQQEYVQETSEDIITNISVTMECTGDLSKQIDICQTDEHTVVGGIGSAYDISVDAEFDTATVTFSYDEAMLGDTKEENLCVLWYNEENDIYDILDDTTVVDIENNTISYTTTHFSDYLLVDKQIWYNIWRKNQNYRSSKEEVYYNVALTVDVSGSMAGSNMTMAQKTLHAFVDALMDRDNACLISYNTYANLICGFCTGSNTDGLKSAIDSLSAYGGTDISSGINLACTQLLDTTYGTKNQDIIVLICDGQSTCSDTVLEGAVRNNIKVNCINVTNGSATELKRIAKATGGEYYYAATSDDLAEVMKQLEKDTLGEIDVTDSDGDGLYDVYEVNGMRIATGDIIYTDPNNADSDDDGIPDGEEMGDLSTEEYEMEGITYSCTLFHNTSNPNKKGTTLPTGWKYVDGMDYLPLSTSLYNNIHYNAVDDDYYIYNNGQTIYGYENIHGIGIKNLTDTLRTELSASHSTWSACAFAASMTHAGKFLQHYLSNQGGINQYDASNIIFQGSIGENYFKNLVKLIEQSENLAKKGETIYLSYETNKNGTPLTGCKSYTEDIPGILGNPNLFLAINSAEAAIVVELSFDGNTYTAKYNYYIIDYYDWDLNPLSLDKLNIYGYSDYYLNYGKYSNTLSWNKDDTVADAIYPEHIKAYFSKQ